MTDEVSAVLAAMDKKQQSAIPGGRDSDSHEGQSLGITVLANQDPVNQRLSSIVRSQFTTKFCLGTQIKIKNGTQWDLHNWRY